MMAEEEILRAAGHVEPGLVGGLGVFLHEVEQVVFAAVEGLGRAECPAHGGPRLALAQQGLRVHRAGKAGRRGKAFRIGQRQFHGPVAAHGQPRHQLRARRLGEAEHAVHHLRQLRHR